ncbi:hypothetical protein GJAV_G00087530 [Gymnothorax javanicus]|nr:hypothetical protein GJAV_G00087530 [Gymnothorax javanicus]
MMQTGDRLRQDTETTLPWLPKQHRIREKEEELHGLESVHMAESETKCTTAGLNTLEPECVTANSRVSDLHHTEAPLIKTEADLSPTNTGDLNTGSLDFTELAYVTLLYPDQVKPGTDDGDNVKTEPVSILPDIERVYIKSDIKLEPTNTGDLNTGSLDFTDLGNETPLHPGQVKTEPDGGDYIQTELISVSPDIKCVDIESDDVKLESGESFGDGLVSKMFYGAGVDEKAETELYHCAGKPNPNCSKSGKTQSDLMQDVGIYVREKPHQRSTRGKSFFWESDLKSAGEFMQEKSLTTVISA